MPHLLHFPAFSEAGVHFIGHSYITVSLLCVVDAFSLLGSEVFLQQSLPQPIPQNENAAKENTKIIFFILNYFYFLLKITNTSVPARVATEL